MVVVKLLVYCLGGCGVALSEGLGIIEKRKVQKGGLMTEGSSKQILAFSNTTK